jgi:hypothetical protein
MGFSIIAIPEKNGKVRVLPILGCSNYCCNVEYHPFPVPKIGEMIHSIEGFTLASELDLNMGYYHIKLDA